MTIVTDELTATVKCEPHQQLLTAFLGQVVDLYSVFCVHFARAMAEADQIAEDGGLKKSLIRYAIESGAIRPTAGGWKSRWRT